MSQLIVKPVRSRRQRRQFLEFPWTLYRDDPYWAPPLRGNQKELVGYRPHPFYERNQVQTFLACRGNEVCGRIAAILNRGHIERYGQHRGFFGFFECIDDQDVADGLFDAARRWFADQGIHSMRGPTNPSQNYELGLLVDGFDSSPFFMMTYNPEYYARLIEGYGFRKAQDLYAYWGHLEMLPKIRDKLQPVAEWIVDRYKLRLRPLDRSRFLADVEEFLWIYNRSLTDTWGFVPMSRAEVQHVARALRHLIVPELTIAAEIDGRTVGACFGMLDYNPRIRQIKGRLFPFGVFRLLSNKRGIKRIRLISTNVIPEYQRMGVGIALMHGLLPKGIQWGLEEVEFSWVLESNYLSRGSLEKGGAKRTKTYRLYDWEHETSGNRGLRSGEHLRCRSRPSEGHFDVLATGRAAAQAGRTATAPVGGGPLEIRPVRGPRDLDQFCKVPWRIYADDPQWVPPLLAEVKEFLNPRKHPFYLHGAATQFLATRGGVPLGRILVSDDPRFNEQHGSNVGCFGMFESADDQEMAHGLLNAAADWLRGRGRSSIRGPIDYSTSYPSGLLIEGFETPPRVMMNHHRPYYAGLLESWGLTKLKDLYSWWFLDPHDMVAKWRRRADRLARRGDVTVRPFRKNDFEAEVRRCQAVYNEALRENWGFTSFTDAEFHCMAKRLARLARPELVLLAEADGRVVGFSITLPDFNEAIRPLNGRLSRFGLPINLLRLAYRRRHIKTARVAVFGLLPGYRRRGIAELMILRTLDCGKNRIGYTGAELGWTLEDNDLINRTVEAVGARHYKTYRIYEKSLSGISRFPSPPLEG